MPIDATTMAPYATSTLGYSSKSSQGIQNNPTGVTTIITTTVGITDSSGVSSHTSRVPQSTSYGVVGTTSYGSISSYQNYVSTSFSIIPTASATASGITDSSAVNPSTFRAPQSTNNGVIGTTSLDSISLLQIQVSTSLSVVRTPTTTLLVISDSSEGNPSTPTEPQSTDSVAVAGTIILSTRRSSQSPQATSTLAGDAIRTTTTGGMVDSSVVNLSTTIAPKSKLGTTVFGSRSSSQSSQADFTLPVEPTPTTTSGVTVDSSVVNPSTTAPPQSKIGTISLGSPSLRKSLQATTVMITSAASGENGSSLHSTVRPSATRVSLGASSVAGPCYSGKASVNFIYYYIINS